MMHRFFIADVERDAAGNVQITDPKVIHQIAMVLRLKKNELFSAFSGSTEYQLAIQSIDKKEITATVLDEHQPNREPSCRVVLYLSLLKKDNLEWVVQKGTELGIATFVLVVTDNTIIRELTANKTRRYQTIIAEATEQCGGKKLPTIVGAVSFDQALEKAAHETGQKLLAWEGETSQQLSTKLDTSAPSYHLLIGPEGGFSEREVLKATAAGWESISLGRRILRAETAAIAATSLILLNR